MSRHDLAVTVTGASGFVGSCLCKRLLSDERYRVRVFGADIRPSDRLDELMSNEDFTFETYSVEQPLHSDLLAVDTLYHFAGIADPQRYLDEPVKVMDLNLMGLRNILDRVTRWSRGRPRIVFSSTSEVYGKNSVVPFSEDESSLVFGPTSVPRWCYAMSKAVCEHYLHAFGGEVPYTIFRFFNFVGRDIDAPGAGRVITRMVGDAVHSGQINVTAPGTQTRTFVCEEDFVEALVLPSFLKREQDGFRSRDHVMNVGTDEEVSMETLASKIADVLTREKLVMERPDIVIRPSLEMYGPGYEDVNRRVPDVSRIRHEWGWSAERALDDFLPDIVQAAAARAVQ